MNFVLSIRKRCGKSPCPTPHRRKKRRENNYKNERDKLDTFGESSSERERKEE
jgi:hypothetical protein